MGWSLLVLYLNIHLQNLFPALVFILNNQQVEKMTTEFAGDGSLLIREIGLFLITGKAECIFD